MMVSRPEMSTALSARSCPNENSDDAFQIELRRDNTCELPALTGDQKKMHEDICGQLSAVRSVANEAAAQSPDLFTAGICPSPQENVQPAGSTEDSQADATSASDTGWWGWTAALLGANATQGALETFCGRLAQEGVRVFSGDPQHAQDVSDRSIAAHAAVNISTAFIAGLRAGLHTYRAMGNPAAYAGGLRGERSAAPSMTFAMAGTPNVPASRLAQLSAGMGVALTTFLVASHSGLVALTQIGSASDYKVDAYKALVKSNGNSAYSYVREGVNLCARVAGLVSHDAMLSPRSVMVSSAQYLINSAGQEIARSSMATPSEGTIDFLWPSVSAAAEFVDVGFISGSARFSEPDRPIAFLGGRFSEHADTRRQPPLTAAHAVDRLTQRAVGRQLVAEITRVVPFEAGAALRPHFGSSAGTVASWGAALLSAATHLREPIWQAERESLHFPS